MSKREIAMILAGALLLGGLTLRGAIYLIDAYAFSDDGEDVTVHRR